MKKTINVITIKNGCPRHEKIANDLQTLQRLVGGNIEAYRIEDVVILCDEEGKIKGKPETMIADGQVFVGDLVICGQDGEEFGDVPRHVRLGKTEEVENDETGHGDS